MSDCPEIIVDDSSHAPETATSTYTTGTTVTYTCNAGFERTTGDEQITCGTDGTWIGTAPTCTGNHTVGHKDKHIQNVLDPCSCLCKSVFLKKLFDKNIYYYPRQCLTEIYVCRNVHMLGV